MQTNYFFRKQIKHPKSSASERESEKDMNE